MILYKVKGNGECKHPVRWRDRIVVRGYLARVERNGYKIESQRPVYDSDYTGLTNREHKKVAS